MHDFYLDLHGYLFNNEPLKYEWRLPDWLEENKEYTKAKLLDVETLRDYHIFHDCGKPFCITIDELGKRHFNNHAEVSFERWKECTADTPRNRLIGELIRSDMDIHLLNSDGLEAFSRRPEAITLLITGLCEIHANASMFGGIDSTSFKIKYKHINKRGKQILNLLT